MFSRYNGYVWLIGWFEIERIFICNCHYFYHCNIEIIIVNRKSEIHSLYLKSRVTYSGKEFQFFSKCELVRFDFDHMYICEISYKYLTRDLIFLQENLKNYQLNMRHIFFIYEASHCWKRKIYGHLTKLKCQRPRT